ncbi:hypothetical protein PFICI_02508 [Pestalotiopsis fici W106-1]|uniref:Xylanolytic transcriptional activator regulatory domain-containing protein n=1 Tax=Pestalotiopsis fici (strain W106-1 / CGMCC3.15140) TaxID=1229662 RepID=W3XEF5_PESFW|nr:uncharacterized protein PFICI_02508 [Pestalotiopsis fici W106-1]ETS84483.1 hypothetical protein PFICI_02508 [Pestalotiopsis fici W106-1]
MSSTSSYTQKVEMAFEYHDPNAGNSTETWTPLVNELVTPTRNSGQGEALLNSHTNVPGSTEPAQSTDISNRVSPTARALSALLPDFEVASLLIDTYFDRVHWFMLVFFQNDFRRRFRDLYNGQKRPTAHATDAFLALVSTVAAIGSQYVGAHRRGLLETYGVDPDNLRREMFATLKNNLLDIVSSGSLEAAQTCVLMGSYYLYQGQRGLAWPICGCALRVALALNLHRARSNLSPDTAEANESKKRCWWAIYEVETFCCMLYGYPSSTSDDDCDVARLDPHHRYRQTEPPTSQDDSRATLLSYKYFMSELSTLTQYTLRELYNARSKSQGGTKPTKENLQRQIRKVTEIDARLLQWKEFAGKIHIKATGPQFEDHICQLQALALKLAYENLRILVHRPLLLYQMVSPRADPFQYSIGVCREAALEISETADMPVFSQATGTYAVSFVSMHLFTAGVTLSIMATLDPLSTQSHHAKAGLRRLMGMQANFKAASTVAAQGLELLQRLTKLLMEKELRFMLSTPTRQATPAQEPSTNRVTRPVESVAPVAPTIIPPSHQAVEFAPTNGMSGVVLTEPTTSPEWEFRQDPVMTEAFMDFENMMLSYSEQGLDGAQGALPASNEYGFTETEQAWLWDLNLA